MAAFNAVRFKVKPGRDQEFLDAHKKIEATWRGLINAIRPGLFRRRSCQRRRCVAHRFCRQLQHCSPLPSLYLGSELQFFRHARRHHCPRGLPVGGAGVEWSRPKPTESGGFFGRSPPARQPRERPAPIYNQHYRRRHGRQYRDHSDIGRLSVIGRWLDWFLKELEKCSAGISDLPSRIVP